LALIPLSIIGNIASTRFLAVTIFIGYGVLSGLKGVDFNQDTVNYVLHFDSAQKVELINWKGFVFGGWFEPGYSSLVLLLSQFVDRTGFIFIVTLVPALIFSWQFLKYKYHPALILLIFSSIVLVASLATVRHYFAMAFSFIIVNHYFYRGKQGVYMIVAPLFHYSSIPLVIAIFVRRYLHRPAIIGVLLLLFVILHQEIFLFVSSLIEHAEDRLSGPTGTTGLRNILVLTIVFVILYFKKESYKADFLILVTFFVAGLLVFLPELNRILSFFMLVTVVYINRYDFALPVFNIRKGIFVINIISVSSLMFFSLNYVARNN